MELPELWHRESSWGFGELLTLTPAEWAKRKRASLDTDGASGLWAAGCSSRGPPVLGFMWLPLSTSELVRRMLCVA